HRSTSSRGCMPRSARRSRTRGAASHRRGAGAGAGCERTYRTRGTPPPRGPSCAPAVEQSARPPQSSLGGDLVGVVDIPQGGGVSIELRLHVVDALVEGLGSDRRRRADPPEPADDTEDVVDPFAPYLELAPRLLTLRAIAVLHLLDLLVVLERIVLVEEVGDCRPEIVEFLAGGVLDVADLLPQFDRALDQVAGQAEAVDAVDRISVSVGVKVCLPGHEANRV